MKMLSLKYALRAGALKVALVAVFKDSVICVCSISFQCKKKS